MADEKLLIEALASSGFKLSIHDKKRVDELEAETAADTKRQFGEDVLPAGSMKNEDSKSLLSTFKNMSQSQRMKVIDSLKQNGLGDPLTKQDIIQNSFTVEKTIREIATQ